MHNVFFHDLIFVFNVHQNTSILGCIILNFSASLSLIFEFSDFSTLYFFIFSFLTFQCSLLFFYFFVRFDEGPILIENKNVLPALENTDPRPSTASDNLLSKSQNKSENLTSEDPGVSFLDNYPIPAQRKCDVRNFLRWRYVEGPRGIDVVDQECSSWSAELSVRSVAEPRAGQVMYALYVLHCRECVQAMGCCSFPGCSHIRSDALIEFQNTVEEEDDENENEYDNDSVNEIEGFGEQSNDTDTTSRMISRSGDLAVTDQAGMTAASRDRQRGQGVGAVEVIGNSDSQRSFGTATGTGTGIGIGSGREGIADLLSILSSRKKLFSSGNHPIEKAIRRYLLSCVFYPSHLIDVVSVLSVTSQESVEADLISLKNIELEQSKKEKYLSLIAVKSRELECDGEYLRYINKRSLEPYATQVMTGEEVFIYFSNFFKFQLFENIKNMKHSVVFFI